MDRRSVLFGMAAGVLLVAGTAKAQAGFPPVPIWRPSFAQPITKIEERFSYYFDGRQDFVILANGTCVSIETGLSLEAATASAFETLAKIFNFHPDMNPAHMDDGNVLVRYNHPAFNVVLAEVARANWAEIDRRHQEALTPDEVLITPQGNNVFDEFGKMALLGRCYMFMDAQAPKVVGIHRAA